MAYNDELVLKMFIQPGNDRFKRVHTPGNDDIKELYVNAVKTHNDGIFSPFAKAGFEFALPRNISCSVCSRRTLHLRINCAMYVYRPYTPSPTGNGYAFWSGFSHPTHPDGSLNKDITIVEIPQAYYIYQNRVADCLPDIESKQMSDETPTNFKSLGLNNIGIIDAGYRGELTGITDNKEDNGEWEWGAAYKGTYDYNFKICHPSLMPFKIVIVDTIEELGNTVKPDSPKDSDNLGLDTQNV